jgi:hypothetical protein
VNQLKEYLTVFLCCCLIAPAPRTFAWQVERDPSTVPVQTAELSPEQMQQLVAPMALYPDSLVAQILAAATYPEQIVEAERWIQQQTELKGAELAKEVDKQPWDPSVKALTQFSSVLSNMDKNLSWTSSLGDAYVNHQQDVMDAIQVMRERAKNAGNLETTPQQKVSNKGNTIVIEPADPQIVYVPQYDPWLVYGAPIIAWPGWYWYPGLYLNGPGFGFGLGLGIGFLGGFGWGWHNWGFDWHHHNIIYNHNNYITHSRTFINRNTFNHAGGNFGRGRSFNGAPGIHPGPGARGGAGFNNGREGAGIHNGAGPQGGHNSLGDRSGGFHGNAFGGFDRGGVTRGFSMRGGNSLGGVHGGGFGGFHGGGGGFHGGGGHR